MSDEQRRPSFKEWLQQARDGGMYDNPTGQQYLHDLEYLKPLFDKTMDSDTDWHNAAAQTIIQQDMPGIMNMMQEDIVKADAFDLGAVIESFMLTLFETAFQMGYEAGEGPEHIRKCDEKHGVEVIDDAAGLLKGLEDLLGNINSN